MIIIILTANSQALVVVADAFEHYLGFILKHLSYAAVPTHFNSITFIQSHPISSTYKVKVRLKI